MIQQAKLFLGKEEEPINTIGNDWLWIGMSECFWENYHEFEPGIVRANTILNNSKEMTYRQALFNVFGRFSVTFALDGKKIDYDIGANFNDAIYDMLETV